MHLLSNPLRDYAWGSTTAIAELLGRKASGRPEAELWIGAHQDAPSRPVGAADGETLASLIAANPVAALGAESVEAFGPRLPYLVKVLAAASPLSLQVHPRLDQAKAGFAAEEAAGVARSAPHRNYKDDNHKPEMIFALTRFEALSGFRRPAEAAALFERLTPIVAGSPAAEVTEQVAELLRTPREDEALSAAFARLIAGGEDVRACVDAVAAAIATSTHARSDDAALATVAHLAAAYPSDPGALISLMLNRVTLSPGEALYLPAGNVHAYLEGLGIEVMAASDNVLRGGLTPKHVDIPELLRTVAFAASAVPMVGPQESELGQELYRPPFTEFQLQRIDVPADGRDAREPVPIAQAGAVVVLVVGGSLTLDTPKGDLALTRGESAFIPDSEAPALAHAGPEGVLAFAVTTGLGAASGLD
ncbi:mannose-6-phosphate isomerase, class I [Sinomonas notoginsengisoli]|uniref:mannose-6-phosphate isomerase, class I n=1 Tax=Sinomonas notoginsengisoli TaxID=1457311 RepID=UPI001F27AF82|nr:mannose-6-phosphate isomerase, class I [Sinomonas notoginsengisoli]